MTVFKVGDKARRVHGSWSFGPVHHSPGTEDVVTAVVELGRGLRFGDQSAGSFAAANYVLVEVAGSAPTASMLLPEDSAERKGLPITTGVLDYFPQALAAVAKCSKAGNDQHNPGQPLHWAKEKSTDHVDCIARHLIDRKTVDTDGVPHAVKLAWRALAHLQTEIEAGRIKL